MSKLFTDLKTVICIRNLEGHTYPLRKISKEMALEVGFGMKTATEQFLARNLPDVKFIAYFGFIDESNLGPELFLTQASDDDFHAHVNYKTLFNNYFKIPKQVAFGMGFIVESSDLHDEFSNLSTDDINVAREISRTARCLVDVMDYCEATNQAIYCCYWHGKLIAKYEVNPSETDLMNVQDLLFYPIPLQLQNNSGPSN